jgi:hypothetical protein
MLYDGALQQPMKNKRYFILASNGIIHIIDSPSKDMVDQCMDGMLPIYLSYHDFIARRRAGARVARYRKLVDIAPCLA